MNAFFFKKATVVDSSKDEQNRGAKNISMAILRCSEPSLFGDLLEVGTDILQKVSKNTSGSLLNQKCLLIDPQQEVTSSLRIKML